MTDQAKKFELFYQLISDTYLLYPVKRTAHFSEPEPNDTSLARLKGAERSDRYFDGGWGGGGATRPLCALEDSLGGVRIRFG